MGLDLRVAGIEHRSVRHILLRSHLVFGGRIPAKTPGTVAIPVLHPDRVKGTIAIVAALGLASLAGAQGYQVQSGTSFQNFQDVSHWYSGDGALSIDGTHQRNGLPSMMLANTSGTIAHASKGISADLSSASTISFWVYAQYPVSDSGWHACSIYLTSDGFKDSFVATSQKLRPGWSRLSFSKTDFHARGNPTWNTPMNAIQMGMFTDTSDSWSVSFSDMELNSYYRPKVIIAFDDNYESSYLYGYTYLKKYGMAGTEFVISGRVGWEGYTSTAELNEMYNYGWDMSNHTTTHPNLTTLNEAQILSEYDTCKQFLISHGWTRNQGYLHVAYPQGGFNSTVLAADQQEGLITARTTMETLGSDMTESPYLLYAMVPDSTQQSVSDILASVDQVVNAGGCLQITFHNLVTTTPATAIQWRVSDFDTIIDHVAQLRDAGKLDVMTLTQWYAGLSSSRAVISSINLPATLVGGNSATGVISMQTASGSMQTVSLKSGSPLVSVPTSVEVQPGQSSSGFKFSSSPTAYALVVRVVASLNGSSLSNTITLLPPTPYRVWTDSPTVVAGSSINAHVVLNGPAPAGGLVITLASGNTALTVPQNVFVSAGSVGTTFTASAGPVSAPLVVRVVATGNHGSASAYVTVEP